MRYAVIVLALILGASVGGQAAEFDEAARAAQRELDSALRELAELRDQIAAEKIPLSRELNTRETTLLNVRADYERVARLLDSRNLDLNNLRTEIKARQEERTYVSNLLAEYIRNFETRVHIAELQRYQAALEAARLAPEKADLPPEEILAKQAAVVEASLQRLLDALGGDQFEGRAVGNDGLVHPGKFVIFGPVAVFASADGRSVGLAEQRLGSLEAAVMELPQATWTREIQTLVSTGRGQLPLDPTLGNAHKIARTRETLGEHIVKGGPVMVPILGLAAAALVVALLKWLQLARIRSPSGRAVTAFLDAVERRDIESARSAARELDGPGGEMIRAGMDHLGQPAELVEEVMYERMMVTRLKLMSWLPFVGLAASAAPLLGLLGTVTGMINTFKMITVFGTGDAKTLSGGISEALITTEFGLIVAIPSLLLYAFLSRKARGVIDDMEKLAVAFLNRLAKTKPAEPLAATAAAGS